MPKSDGTPYPWETWKLPEPSTRARQLEEIREDLNNLDETLDAIESGISELYGEPSA